MNFETFFRFYGDFMLDSSRLGWLNGPLNGTDNLLAMTKPDLFKECSATLPDSILQKASLKN